MPWGATRDEARRTMVGRGARFEPRGSDEKVQVFEGGKFAGQDAGRWELRFAGGEFDDARVWLKGGGKAESLYRRMTTLLSGRYGSGNSKQVGHRLPPHFVLGLGWRMGGSTKPPLHADWLAESALSGRTMAISCWVAGDDVQVQYQHRATKSAGAPLSASKKTRPEDDL